MKWIKPRNIFLTEEAKIRDLILPKQISTVKDTWGEKWLDVEEVEPTDKIKQGKWKISDEDKITILSDFFMCDLKSVYKFFNNLPDKLNEVIKLSIKPEMIKNEKNSKLIEDFDIQKPSIDQICILTEPIFRKISVSETNATEIMVRDENGRPIMDDDNKPIKRKKEEGEIIFSNNLVNINTFASDYNRLFPDNAVSDISKFASGEIQQLISTSRDTVNSEYTVDYNIFSKDMYLSIKHNPKDILNMSISKYYSSCQHLYSGCYRGQVLSNVFDINSVPAFIIFETPIKWDNDIISDILPLCRMQIRNIEGFSEDVKDDKSPKIYFDRSYPDRMYTCLSNMIEKYSSNKKTVTSRAEYLFTPDIPEDLKLKDYPYMDNLDMRKGILIGKNTKKLYLSRNYDWSSVIISPKANIEELVIETPEIPENFLSLKLNPDWVKFKFMKLNNFDVFNNIKTDSIAFDKCKFNNDILEQVNKLNPNLKKLSIIACEIDNIDLSLFKNLDELHIIYSLEDKLLSDIINDVKTKKLFISSDVVINKENKDFINQIKRKGTKVETIGPKI